MGDGTMKHVEHSDPIDLRQWSLPFEGQGSIAAQLTIILQDQFEEDPPSLWMPFMWADGEGGSDGVGGPAPDDPLTLYLELPLGATDDQNCCWAVSLEGVLEDFLDMHRGFLTDMVDSETGRALCAQVSARLRELAQKIDDACKESTDAGL